jgi:hypothetical protein
VQKPDLKPFQIDDARVGILKIEALRRLSSASKKCARCEKAPTRRFCLNFVAYVTILGNQAMKTAMKANKKIRIAPPTGKTMGMSGTMDSTTSCSACVSCDMTRLLFSR